MSLAEPAAAPAERRARLARLVLAALFALLCAAHICLFAYVVARRLGFRYELEWMEGGMLGHSLRLLRGEPIYGAPTADFIPFLYTPLYPALVAALAKVAGLGFSLGRAVSVVSFASAAGFAALLARRAGSGRAALLFALGCAAALCATFPGGGAWYDIVRGDSLYLSLSLAGLWLAATRGDRAALAALAGALLAAAFFAKQTGSVLAIAGGLCTLLYPRGERRGFARLWPSAAFALAAGAVFSGGVVLLQLGSAGWFWRYVYELHQQHEFYARRAWLETPVVLLRGQPVLWAGLLVALGLLSYRRALDRFLGRLAILATAGVALACIGFGTQYAHTNAYIPGLFFPVLLWAALLARLHATGARLPALVLACAHLGAAYWDPRPHLPSPADTAAGDRLIARLRAAPGPVLIPFHPFYAVMAGKAPHLHRMGILDIGMPRDLEERIRRREYDLVVMDDKTQWPRWSVLQQVYGVATTLVPGVDAPRVVTGAPTVPTWAMEPRSPGP